VLNTTVSRKIVFFISLVLLLGCSAGVFLLVVTPTERLQSDYDAFAALDGKLARLQIELLRTQTHPVRRQQSVIREALADLDEQFAEAEPILEKIRSTLLRHHQYTFGPELEEFEEKMARYTGARYCLGTASGTTALSMLLKAAGVGEGDEVITVSQTFVATIGSIVAVGARPYFIDVLEDFTMDPGLIERAITPRTKALMPVWYSGAPPRMEEIIEIAERHSLPVIEDSCCAISARLGKKHAGTFGVGGAFSVHPLKNLNVWGDGGFIVTDSQEVYEKIVLLRNHGLKNRDEAEIFGSPASTPFRLSSATISIPGSTRSPTGGSPTRNSMTKPSRRRSSPERSPSPPAVRRPGTFTICIWSWPRTGTACLNI